MVTTKIFTTIENRGKFGNTCLSLYQATGNTRKESHPFNIDHSISCIITKKENFVIRPTNNHKNG